MAKLLPPKLFYCQDPLFAPQQNNSTEIKSLFEKAVAESNLTNVRPDDEMSLRLYSLYKQATKGDINISLPADTFDNVEKAKLEAWAGLKGKSVREAQDEFIRLVYLLKSC